MIGSSPLRPTLTSAMPKMRRFIESLRTGKSNFGGPSKTVTILLELGGGYHLTCCSAVVGEDWIQVTKCVKRGSDT